MSTEENLFLSSVFQRKDVSLDFAVPSNKRVIRISHAKLTGTCSGDGLTDIAYHDICTLADHQVIVSVPDFLLLSERQCYTEKMAEILTKLKVPEFEQPPIIDKIFMEVELADNPEWPIACFIKDITLFHQTINLAYQLESFEKVRIDSLEDTVRQQQCVICKESLDHFEGVEEGIDRGQLMIIHLSCSHLYHEDCIFQWLAKSQLCPLCRHSMAVVEQATPVVEQATPVVEQAILVVEQAMPVVEQAAEPSKPSWWHLRWPMLLTASAGGILTAMLVKYSREGDNHTNRK
ncbi:uncharacterized protein LOC133746271 isoform X2 [Rosa rugosa]|uniref:uncharacterized protein LOC133746271 isoform X2 n=1 Tax=Rosa rugosa TaxID=74645 RepID=UPI002B40ADDF|nr:uncharacterized protein LOC133746271 isoform X2 [Rosa rugosa]